MAQGINKVILIGNLGADPELRQGPTSSVAKFSLATSEVWKNKDSGNNEERTEWHRIAIFGKLADIAAQYLKKGSKVYLEGHLRTNKWQDQHGIERYTTEIVVDEMHMLDNRLQTEPATTANTSTNPIVKNILNLKPTLANSDYEIPF